MSTTTKGYTGCWASWPCWGEAYFDISLKNRPNNNTSRFRDIRVEVRALTEEHTRFLQERSGGVLNRILTIAIRQGFTGGHGKYGGLTFTSEQKEFVEGGGKIFEEILKQFRVAGAELADLISRARAKHVEHLRAALSESPISVGTPVPLSA